MEATLTPTLTTGAAWRMALSLTLADVRSAYVTALADVRAAITSVSSAGRSFFHAAFLVIKAVAAVIYLLAATVLTLSDVDDSIILNFLGLALFFVAYRYVVRHQDSTPLNSPDSTDSTPLN